jgi:hypothetical protein
MKISNDAKLNMADGKYKIFQGRYPRHPRRIHGGAPPPPPISLEQLLAMQNDLMRRLVENDEHHGAERQQPRHQERDSSYSDFLTTQFLSEVVFGP